MGTPCRQDNQLLLFCGTSFSDVRTEYFFVVVLVLMFLLVMARLMTMRLKHGRFQTWRWEVIVVKIILCSRIVGDIHGNSWYLLVCSL